MSTRLPTYVDIGPFRYSIKIDGKRLDKDGHTEEIGMCYRYSLEIVLREGLVPGRQREVLWHEIKHGCTELVGIHVRDRLSEEQAILRVAAVELAVLRQNPMVAAFLLDGAGPIAPLPGNTV